MTLLRRGGGGVSRRACLAGVGRCCRCRKGGCWKRCTGATLGACGARGSSVACWRWRGAVVAQGGLVEEDTVPFVLDGDAACARERDGVGRVQPRRPEDHVDVGVERQAVGVDRAGERRPDGERHAAGVSDGDFGAVGEARGGGALEGAQMQVVLLCERFTHEH